MIKLRVIPGSLLLLALLLRLTFVLGLQESPLYWDEPYYNASANRYRDAWKSVFNPEPTIPLLHKAFKGSLQKGESYSMAVGMIYAVFGPRPRVVFLFQAVLDTLTCLFIYGLSRRLGGPWVGLIALALATVYEPFIFSSARLQTETFATFLYIGGLWFAFASPSRRRGMFGFIGGFLIALSTLARPALQFLFPLLVPAMALSGFSGSWRLSARLTLAFVAGFFLLIGPRLVLTKAVSGKASWAGTLEPSVELYAGAVIENLGWKTDRLSFAYPPRDELLGVLGGDITRRPTFSDYKRATLLTWLNHPIGSAGVALHKLYVAWVQPYNDSHHRFLMGLSAQRPWHQILLTLGVIGMALALPYGCPRRVSIPMIIACLYLWMVYLVVKIEVRYAFPVMPLMVCFAALAITVLWAGLKRGWCSRERRGLITLVMTLVVCMALVRLLSLPRLLSLMPLLDPKGAYGLRTGTIVFLIVLVFVSVVWVLCGVLSTRRAMAAMGVPLVLTVLVFLGGRPHYHVWREWWCPLSVGRGVIRQEFVLPEGLGSPNRAELKLDLLPGQTGDYDLVVRVNGREMRRYYGGPRGKDADLPKEDYYKILYELWHFYEEPVHAWYTIPLSPEIVSSGNRLEVEVWVEGKTGSVTVFGDYPAPKNSYDGPSPFSPELLADTSIYRYLGTGDFRMRRRIKPGGLSRSAFYTGGDWSYEDLCLEPGRQYGRYRIFLVLTHGDRLTVF